MLKTFLLGVPIMICFFIGMYFYYTYPEVANILHILGIVAFFVMLTFGAGIIVLIIYDTYKDNS